MVRNSVNSRCPRISPPRQVRSMRRTTVVQASPVTHCSRRSSSPDAYAAPTSAPMEVPQMKSGLMPRSSSARMAPMCAQPRALPEPRARPIRGGRRITPQVYRLCALENRRDALAAADAHRHERVALADALKLEKCLDGEDASGRADRVPKRDRAAVRVDLCGIETQILGHRHGLHGKGFVGLDDV